MFEYKKEYPKQSIVEDLMNIPEQRMYFLVMYNISDIQKGIQAGHALQEYNLLYGDDLDFKGWAYLHKTFMVMNGGTCNVDGVNAYNDSFSFGSMEQHISDLMGFGVKCAPFYEPDLNNSMSAIAFLVNESAWNQEKYPNLKTMKDYQNAGIDYNLQGVDLREAIIKYYMETYSLNLQDAFLKYYVATLRFA